MLGHNFKLNLRTAVRARAFDNAFELHGKVDGVVVERMDAGAHKLERLVNRAFDVGEIGGNPGLVGVHDAQGLGLQRARVSWWPTLSWISRAIRARSASVASSTS